MAWDTRTEWIRFRVTKMEKQQIKSNCPVGRTLADWLRSYAICDHAVVTGTGNDPAESEFPSSARSHRKTNVVTRTGNDSAESTRHESCSDTLISSTPISSSLDPDLSSPSKPKSQAPGSSRPARAKQNQGTLDVGYGEGIGDLLAGWHEVGEPFSLLDEPARARKARHLLRTYPLLNQDLTALAVADRWGDIGGKERGATKRTKGGVASWISTQYSLREKWRQKDALEVTAAIGPAATSKDLTGRAAGYTKKQLLVLYNNSRERFLKPPMDFGDWVVKWDRRETDDRP